MFELNPDTQKDLIAFAFNAGQGRHHITRLYMYKAIKNALSSFDGKDKTCLAISHSSSLGYTLGLQNVRYQEANYPDHSLTDLKIQDDYADFCISDQVLEHVEGDPFIAFKESVRVVKPGGFVCHTTCFINPRHGAPSDFWRFTPDALALLAKSSGCSAFRVDGWGNREAWSIIESGFRFNRIPEDEQNPLYRIAMRNERDWPIVTWIIAQKDDAA